MKEFNELNIKITGGYIPSGKEYVRVIEVVKERKERSGSFQMQFKNGCFENAELLTVKYKKPLN